MVVTRWYLQEASSHKLCRSPVSSGRAIAECNTQTTDEPLQGPHARGASGSQQLTAQQRQSLLVSPGSNPKHPNDQSAPGMAQSSFHSLNIKCFYQDQWQTIDSKQEIWCSPTRELLESPALHLTVRSTHSDLKRSIPRFIIYLHNHRTKTKQWQEQTLWTVLQKVSPWFSLLDVSAMETILWYTGPASEQDCLQK